jgi:hypothetical protein
MPPISEAAVADSLPDFEIEFVPSSSGAASVPPGWRPILTEDDPMRRRDVALALWPASITDALPRFQAVLHDLLADVRVVRADKILALVYILDDDENPDEDADADDPPRTWLGYDPATFGTEPPFWTSFPPLLTWLLRDVHAGFVGIDALSYGVTPPRFMRTLAQLMNQPDGYPYWDENEPYRSTRLLRFSASVPTAEYYLSPDLPADHLAIIYEGDIDVRPFPDGFDRLLEARLTAQL